MKERIVSIVLIIFVNYGCNYAQKINSSNYFLFDNCQLYGNILYIKNIPDSDTFVLAKKELGSNPADCFLIWLNCKEVGDSIIFEGLAIDNQSKQTCEGISFHSALKINTTNTFVKSHTLFETKSDGKFLIKTKSYSTVNLIIQTRNSIFLYSIDSFSMHNIR